MPMVPRPWSRCLACARIGAVHSWCSAALPRKARHPHHDAQPKLILSASCGIEPGRIVQYSRCLDEAIRLAGTKPRPASCCNVRSSSATPHPRPDYDWAACAGKALNDGKSAVRARRRHRSALHPLHSGTTAFQGRGCATMAAISRCEMVHVQPLWRQAGRGLVVRLRHRWVVGHSYIVYGPLLHGATSIMYEGSRSARPMPAAFWRVISEHKLSPSHRADRVPRAIRKDDPEGKFIRRYDLSTFRTRSSPASAPIRRRWNGRSSS